MPPFRDDGCRTASLLLCALLKYSLLLLMVLVVAVVLVVAALLSLPVSASLPAEGQVKDAKIKRKKAGADRTQLFFVVFGVLRSPHFSLITSGVSLGLSEELVTCIGEGKGNTYRTLLLSGVLLHISKLLLGCW